MRELMEVALDVLQDDADDELKAWALEIIDQRMPFGIWIPLSASSSSSYYKPGMSITLRQHWSLSSTSKLSVLRSVSYTTRCVWFGSTSGCSHDSLPFSDYYGPVKRKWI